MIPVTLLSSYLYCSRKLFIQQALKIREPAKPELALGSIRHECYEKINEIEKSTVLNINESNYADLGRLYLQKYSDVLKYIINSYSKEIKELNLDENQIFSENLECLKLEAFQRSSLVLDFIKKYKVFGKDLWKILVPKIRSELKLESASLDLKGYLDRLEIYDEQIIPVELKTGSIPQAGLWPSHRIQIAAYSVLIEDIYGVEIKKAIVHYLDHNQRRELYINPFMKLEIIKLVKEINGLLDKKELPDFTENRNKCKSCGVREYCYSDKPQHDVDNLLLQHNKK